MNSVGATRFGADPEQFGIVGGCQAGEMQPSATAPPCCLLPGVLSSRCAQGPPVPPSISAPRDRAPRPPWLSGSFVLPRAFGCCGSGPLRLRIAPRVPPSGCWVPTLGCWVPPSVSGCHLGVRVPPSETRWHRFPEVPPRVAGAWGLHPALPQRQTPQVTMASWMSPWPDRTPGTGTDPAAPRHPLVLLPSPRSHRVLAVHPPVTNPIPLLLEERCWAVGLRSPPGHPHPRFSRCPLTPCGGEPRSPGPRSASS